jgi:hypothetical protein
MKVGSSSFPNYVGARELKEKQVSHLTVDI